MADDRRSIELEITVPGTPEEVWRAIATGPGISSWYVPHVVEEREGGAATASFGPGPEMQMPGRVAAWDPPHRIVFDGGEGVDGLAFEWIVEARDASQCVVRLVNSGFGDGGAWDEQYDQLQDGWKLFMLNLGLHLTHFDGLTARSMLPMAMWNGDRAACWDRVTALLGIPTEPLVGDRLTLGPAGGPTLVGSVQSAERWRIVLLVDEPANGTAFVAVEGTGDEMAVSIWSYLYGDAGAAAVERDGPRWRSFLADHAGR